MSQFTNYDNLSSDYVPINIGEIFENPSIELITKLPRFLYNKCGQLIGYAWAFNDNISIPISVNKIITVDPNSIIYTVAGEKPTPATVGQVMQKAYNTVDMKSWTCIGIGDIYSWSEDPDIIFELNGALPITLTPDMTDKSIYCTISNFRREVLLENTFSSTNETTWDITLEDYETLQKGIYYLTLYIVTLDGDDAIKTSTMINSFELYINEG